MLTNAGRVAAAVGAVVLTSVGALLFLSDDAKDGGATRVEKAFDGGAPKGATCLTFTGLIEAGALARDGLKAEKAEYGVVTVCGEKPEAPSGMRVMQVTKSTSAYRDGAAYKVALQGEAEFPCACSTGADCEMRAPDGGWMPAWTGNTLSAGQWRGDGCFRKACVEGLGWASSWPPECPE